MKPDKLPYRPNVHLTKAEYQAFVEMYGEEKAAMMFDKLSNYKEAHGKKYKSDAAAIRSWVAEEIDKRFKVENNGSKKNKSINRKEDGTIERKYTERPTD